MRLIPSYAAFVLLSSLSAASLGLAQSAAAAQDPAAGSSLQRAAYPHALQADRVNRRGDFASRVRLAGQLPSWATPTHQLASPEEPTATLRITAVLRRDPAVQSAFEKLLIEQQDPASPLYHHWLSPQQVGEVYGPTQNDVETFGDWAQREGLTIDSIAPSRMLVELSAPSSVVANAFHTRFARYEVDGRPRYSAEVDPSIPAALAPLVHSVSGFHEAIERHGSHSQEATETRAEDDPSPQYSNGSNHFVTPGDFAVIYNINPVYSAGNTGATIGSDPQHIAIIDEAPVFPQDIADYAARVGLSSYNFNTIAVATVDNPTLSDGESDLDVSRTIGSANGAVSDLLLAGANYGGIYAAAAYNVNTLVDKVMTLSWLNCERTSSLAYVARWDTLFSIAAAEGISVFVASGDSGADTCEAHDAAPVTPQALHINAICASSYATCVGGTQFNDTLNPSLYWSSINASGRVSALSYIPEGAWNANSTTDLDATGGGVSLFVPRPTWQVGTGVPAGQFRTVPDVSFSSSGHDGYYICQSLSCESGHFYYYYGTSASAPGMAAVAALLNTRAGTPQGNLNPLIYRLANSSAAASIFNDVTIASSGVTNCDVTIPSLCNNSLSSPTFISGLPGYLLQTGYDEVTGWGSLNVANFLTAAVPVSSVLTLTASNNDPGMGQAVLFTAALSPASNSVAAPTGSVQFYLTMSPGTLGTPVGAPVALNNNTATSPPITLTGTGPYYITAVYSGDSYYSGTSSTQILLEVSAPQLTTTSVLSSVTVGYQASITVTNTGSGTANNVQLVTATLGNATVTADASLGDLGPGHSVTLVLKFPSSAGTDDSAVLERFTGTYGGGTFGGTVRTVLP